MDDVYGAASSASPRARRLRAVTVCACLLALTSAASGTASPARHRPPHHRGHMSSATPFPYIAPWQTGFTRYSTQLYTPESSTATTLTWTVPAGQWWRIIYIRTTGTTDANAGNRIPELVMSDATNTIELRLQTPLAVPASTTFGVVWGPNMQAFANTGSNLFFFGEGPTPEVLWPPFTQFQVRMEGSVHAGDSYSVSTAFSAVEIYTEDYHPVATVTVPPPITPLML